MKISPRQQTVIDWLESEEGQEWSRDRVSRNPTRTTSDNPLHHQSNRDGIFADVVDDHPDKECHCKLLAGKSFRWRPVAGISPSALKHLEQFTGSELTDKGYL